VSVDNPFSQGRHVYSASLTWFGPLADHRLLRPSVSWSSTSPHQKTAPGARADVGWIKPWRPG
jgi:hypothetical protein